MAKKIQGIPYDDIKKVDKVRKGVYKLILKDDSVKDLSLDPGEAISIQASIRHRSNNVSGDASQKSDSANSAPSAQNLKLQTEISREALERNLGNWMDVKFRDPNVGGYWPTDDRIPYFRNIGYEFATPEDIEDFDVQFGDFNPGEGLTPNGHICRMGHTLMKARKELQQALQDHNYKKRDLFKVENRPDFISQGQLAQKLANYKIV